MSRQSRRSRSWCMLVPALVGLCACSSRATEPAAPAPPAAVEPTAVLADAGPPGPVQDARTRDFTEKHMVFDDDLDAGPIPLDHTDRRWGDYIDRNGRPAVGWHSHDRDAGNAR